MQQHCYVPLRQQQAASMDGQRGSGPFGCSHCAGRFWWDGMEPPVCRQFQGCTAGIRSLGGALTVQEGFVGIV
jgi:hypothetical protein